MKTLITVNEIKDLANTGKNVLYVEPNTIITPAAKDAANEWGISIKIGSALEVVEEKYCKPVPEITPVGENTATTFNSSVGSSVNADMITKIVMEVIASLSPFNNLRDMAKEVDPSGIALVRGETVECETLDTGNPRDKVGIKEVLTRKESPNLATGFMTLEDSSFDWHLGYEEIDYIIEGTLDITVNGKNYRGRAGDVFYIPRDTKITFSTPDKVKFFFVTYPANWAELSNK